MKNTDLNPSFLVFHAGSPHFSSSTHMIPSNYPSGKRDEKSPLADDITDKPGATNFSHSLAMAQDVEDAVEALVHLQLGKLFDVIVHDEKLAWKTKNDLVGEDT